MLKSAVVHVLFAVVLSTTAAGYANGRQSLAAAVNIAGTWSGQYQITDRCDDGTTLSSSGVATAAFTQNGASAFGYVKLIDAVFSEDGRSCQRAKAPATYVLPTTAILTDTRYTGTFVDVYDADAPIIPLSGTASPTALTLSFPALPVTEGTFTLTRSGSQAPEGTFTGRYSGTYSRLLSAQDLGCIDRADVLMSSGPVTLTVQQIGEIAAGTLTLTRTRRFVKDSSGRCSVEEVDEQIPIVGTFKGTTLEVDDSLKLNFTLNSVSLSASGRAEELSLNATKASSSPPVTIAAFSANRRSIRSGETATLSWSTINATSVSIAPAVGPRGAIDSVAVSPSSTTTYTLTANGEAGDTAVATITIAVSGGVPKRRVARH